MAGHPKAVLRIRGGERVGEDQGQQSGFDLSLFLIFFAQIKAFILIKLFYKNDPYLFFFTFRSHQWCKSLQKEKLQSREQNMCT